MSLKDLTVNGIIWKAVGNVSTLVVEFIIGIILARLLSPNEFGLIGTISILIVISEVFVNSGFSQAIIRKQNCSQKDYSTTFYFNLIVSIVFYVLLLIIAKPVSHFFKTPELEPLIKVLGIGLVISAFTLIQHAIITKNVNFKLYTKISFIAAIFSGIIAVIMAFLGFGVWSLVIKTLLSKIISSILLWTWSKWRPIIVFSKQSFNELFGFGSKLLLSGVIGTILNNLNNIAIAKFFSTQTLGFYSRANQFEKLFSENITSVVSSVSYPVLSTLQNDTILMKKVYREIYTTTFFIISLCMVGIAVIAKSLIITLIGEEWLPSVELLQLLCVVGVITPLNSMNINLLNVVGRSDLYFKLQLYVQLLFVPNLLLGYFFGVKALIIGAIFITLTGFFIFNIYTKKYINYSIKEQLIDNFPSSLLALVTGLFVFLLGYFIKLQHPLILIIQIISGSLFVVLCGELFKIKVYYSVKKITFLQIKRLIKVFHIKQNFY